MGETAVRALVEVEQGTAEAMRKSRTAYPAPVVRLALMARAADRLGMKGTAALGEVSVAPMTAGDKWLEQALALVDDVLDFAFGTSQKISVVSTLQTLYDADAVKPFGANGSAADLAQKLRSGDPIALNRKLSMPRLMTGSALRAWATLVGLAMDAQLRSEALTALAERAQTEIRRCAPPEERSLSIVIDTQQGEGVKLADKLLRLGRERSA